MKPTTAAAVGVGTGVVLAVVVAVTATVMGADHKVVLSYDSTECVTGSPTLNPLICTPGGGLFCKKKVEWKVANKTCDAQPNGSCYWEIAYSYDLAVGKFGEDHLVGGVDPIVCGDHKTFSKVDKHDTHGDPIVTWPYEIRVFKCKKENGELVRGDPLCVKDPRVYIKK